MFTHHSALMGLISLAFSLFSHLSEAAETPVLEKTGIAGMQLVSDATSIAPGETITVGLVIRHQPLYHTYWKGPGIVGVATNFHWKLPEGFTAGEVQWPAPQITKMAGITAYGFETDTCLLVPITAPAKLEGKSVSLQVRCGWMACAKSCHPSWHDFSLPLPVNRSGKSTPVDAPWSELFKKTRARFPSPAPDDWKFSLENHSAESFSLSVNFPEKLTARTKDLYFFSYDLQVNSDEPQQISAGNENKQFKLELVRPEYAPENPPSISGVLYHPDGFGNPDTKWMEINVPWKSKPTATDE